MNKDFNLKSIVFNTDGYKFGQWQQWPEGTTNGFFYIESRGGLWDHTLFVGLQMFLKEYLLQRVTVQDVEDAKAFVDLYQGAGIFNYEGWMYIATELEGKLPLRIKALPEGTVIKGKNMLVSVEVTDPKCKAWLASFIETPLLRAVWYPTTVGTNSYECKKLIAKYVNESGTPESLPFKLHDFGARGVSSFESAGIGGCAHLVNFTGTDTVTGILYAMRYYGASVCGAGIPAMEHSTVTSWGRENEAKAYSNMLDKFAKPGSILACVSDSYDIYNACDKLWGEELRQKVIDSGAKIVIRPDSGNPVEVVSKCLKILGKRFGYTINEKGYKVLNYVGIIQGDGINYDSIRNILFNCVDMQGWSIDNIAFGMGGALLQQLDRDTLKFAMKCSAALIDDKWVDVYKDPITDQGKTSKKGRLAVVRDGVDGFKTVREDWEKNLLETVFENGELTKEETFDIIRQRANKAFI